MKKRLFAMLMCVALLVSMLPATVQAVSHTAGWDPTESYTIGDEITIDNEIYYYGGKMYSSNPFDFYTPPNQKTIYLAGGGYVLWTPKDAKNPDKMTLNDAQITVTNNHSIAFWLPDAPVIVELKGTNRIKLGDDTNYCRYFFGSSNSVELTGPGTINAPDEGWLINSLGKVTLSGVFSGNIEAEKVEMNDVTILENTVLSLSVSSKDSITAKNVVNDGVLELKNNQKSADIVALGLTGSGFVRVEKEDSNYSTASPIPVSTTPVASPAVSPGDEDPSSNDGNSDEDAYYTNDGTPIPYRTRPINFSLPAEYGDWEEDATLAKDGYSFTGNKEEGYILKLGYLILDTTLASTLSIVLPGDGFVKVILSDNTTTRIISGSYSGMLFNRDTGASPMRFNKKQQTKEATTNTVSGNGKLMIDSTSYASLEIRQPLTIEGGDIEIRNRAMTNSFGIDANNTDITISGGSLNVRTNGKALSAENLTLERMAITSPDGATFDAEKHAICNEDGSIVAKVTIEEIVVDSVTVSPESVTVQVGESQAFYANVVGKNIPDQTVSWTVEGGVTGTTIDKDGKLTVAADETATLLTVKATSTMDTTKNGEATVKVLGLQTPTPIATETVSASTTPAPTITPSATVSAQIEYEIIEGKNSKWTKGSNKNLSFAADVEYSKFTDVSVDDKDISSNDYTSKSGSTIVTLKASYLNKLSIGKHAVRINFTDGYADANFEVKAASNTGDDTSYDKKAKKAKKAEKDTSNSGASENPATGDESRPVLWLCIVLLSCMAFVACIILRRKKCHLD